jgi:hypothetical protein
METALQPWPILTHMSVERPLPATPVLRRPARLVICLESTEVSRATSTLPTPTTSLLSRRALAPSSETGVSSFTSQTRPASLAPTSSALRHAAEAASHPPPHPGPVHRPQPAGPPGAPLPPQSRRSAATRLRRAQARRPQHPLSRLPETPTPRRRCSPPELQHSHSSFEPAICSRFFFFFFFKFPASRVGKGGSPIGVCDTGG